MANRLERKWSCKCSIDPTLRASRDSSGLFIRGDVTPDPQHPRGLSNVSIPCFVKKPALTLLNVRICLFSSNGSHQKCKLTSYCEIITASCWWMKPKTFLMRLTLKSSTSSTLPNIIQLNTGRPPGWKLWNESQSTTTNIWKVCRLKNKYSWSVRAFATMRLRASVHRFRISQDMRCTVGERHTQLDSSQDWNGQTYSAALLGSLKASFMLLTFTVWLYE